MNNSATQLALLGGLELHRGSTCVQLPLGAQRLLALLALEDSGILRSIAAERLWPDCQRTRAPANLRTALWQANRFGGLPLIESSGSRIRLASHVKIDLWVIRDSARRICKEPEIDGNHAPGEVVAMLSRELLPDWCDDWLFIARERWDQVRMHTLEILARRMTTEEQYLAALEAAFAAVAVEPVRESAHRAVIEVYLAEGNAACALKHYLRYRGLVQRELGVTPSPRMTRLVESLTAV